MLHSRTNYEFPCVLDSELHRDKCGRTHAPFKVVEKFQILSVNNCNTNRILESLIVLAADKTVQLECVYLYHFAQMSLRTLMRAFSVAKGSGR